MGKDLFCPAINSLLFIYAASCHSSTPETFSTFFVRSLPVPTSSRKSQKEKDQIKNILIAFASVSLIK